MSAPLAIACFALFIAAVPSGILLTCGVVIGMTGERRRTVAYLRAIDRERGFAGLSPTHCATRIEAGAHRDWAKARIR